MAKDLATVSVTLPNGEIWSFDVDFEADYPLESLEYMFTEGNYSCDCNKREFLGREAGACGNTIRLDRIRWQGHTWEAGRWTKPLRS